MKFSIAIVFLMWAAPVGAMDLHSPDLADGAAIARAQIYTRCGGSNIAPALAWSGEPQGTETFALTMIDVNVPPANWTHWIVVDIPANVHSLPKGGALPAGASAVKSNFGDATYDGPCPPAGTGVHHYQITVYALPGRAPAIKPDAKAGEVSAALSRAALAKATITGTAQH